VLPLLLLLLTLTLPSLGLVRSPLLQGGGAALLNAHDLAWVPVLGGLVLPQLLLLLLLLLTLPHLGLVRSLLLQGGGAALLNAHDLAWAPVLGGLVLGLRHLGLGGLAPAEAMAIEAELAAWQKEGNFRDRDNALRWAHAVQDNIYDAVLGCG
jgi:hypothetical protein